MYLKMGPFAVRGWKSSYIYSDLLCNAGAADEPAPNQYNNSTAQIKLMKNFPAHTIQQGRRGGTMMWTQKGELCNACKDPLDCISMVGDMYQLCLDEGSGCRERADVLCFSPSSKRMMKSYAQNVSHCLSGQHSQAWQSIQSEM